MARLADDYTVNKIMNDIKEAEDKCIEEYRKQNVFQKFITDAKLDIDILRNKHMSLKDKIFTIVFGA